MLINLGTDFINQGTDYIQAGYLEESSVPYLSSFIPGLNVAYRRQAIIDAGLYDDRFITGEDADMCWRVVRRGWKAYFEPQAEVYHFARPTVRKFIKQMSSYAAGSVDLLLKHGASGLTLVHMVQTPSGRLVRAPWYRLEQFPVKCVIPLTRFVLMHVAMAAFLAAWLLGTPTFVLGAFAVLLMQAMWGYWRGDARWGGSILNAIRFGILRYVLLVCMAVTSLCYGIRRGFIYIFP